MIRHMISYSSIKMFEFTNKVTKFFFNILFTIHQISQRNMRTNIVLKLLNESIGNNLKGNNRIRG